MQIKNKDLKITILVEEGHACKTRLTLASRWGSRVGSPVCWDSPLYLKAQNKGPHYKECPACQLRISNSSVPGAQLWILLLIQVLKQRLKCSGLPKAVPVYSKSTHWMGATNELGVVAGAGAILEAQQSQFLSAWSSSLMEGWWLIK